MHFFRFLMIATLLAVSHSLPLTNPQPLSARDVHGDGDVIIKRVPWEYPPAAPPPSAPLTNKGHVKRDPPAPDPETPKSIKLNARDGHIEGTKQGQFKDTVPSNSKEQKQSQALATGKRIH